MKRRRSKSSTAPTVQLLDDEQTNCVDSILTVRDGFSMALLAAFVVMTDLYGVTIGLFRTFGTNVLAAYFLHHSLEIGVLGIVPKDSPLW